MGKLLSTNDAPSGQLAFTDGALVNAGMFQSAFPYLNSPLPGSPNEPSVTITLQSSAQVNGPFHSVPASFDAATRQLATPKRPEDASFYRLKADRAGTQLGQPSVGENTVQLGVKTP